MKKILLTIGIMIGILQMAGAVGTMTSVYLNPVGGVDSNAGTLTYPVQSWDKALQLAANNATIYLAWGAVPMTSDMVINGNQYGATNITVAQNSGYTGALFAIADGATGIFSNVTLKGSGAAHALITVNSGGTLTIGNDVSITDEGQISLDGGAKAINLTATPLSAMKYQLITRYDNAADEGRAIVNAGSVSNPLQYFTLIKPESTASIAYELVLDGSIIRLYELAVGGIYLDPLNGNDAYSGAKSNRPVKTLAKAMAIWDDRNTTPGTVTDIFLLSRITLTANTTFDGGYKITRFGGDADRAAAMTDYMIEYTGYDVTIDDYTIDNGTASGYALYSYNHANGKLTLNNGANILSGNNNYCIYSYYGNVTVNNGAKITNYGNSGTSLYAYSATVTINDGATFTGKGIAAYNLLYILYGTATINGGTFKNEGTSTTAKLLYTSGATTINGGTFDAGGATAIYQGSNNLTLNKCTLSSTNTTDGALYSAGEAVMNGEDVKIDGFINLVRTTAAFELYFLYINSATVTQNYKLKLTLSSNSQYCPAVLVKSNPSIDLGLYYNKFTLEAIPGYDFIAYAPQNETNRNLVLYSTNAVYVSDYTGNDANSGASPASALKTLVTAVTKTTATKKHIYICDSTLTINNTQNVASLAGIDTIMPCFFRTRPTHMITIATGGTLTLGSIATKVYTSYNSSHTIYVNDGSLILNSDATLFSQNISSSTYVIYVNKGHLTMNNKAKITASPTSSTIYAGSGIYLTGTTSTATLNSGSVIEKQTSSALYVNNIATLTINGAVIRDCMSSGCVPLRIYGTNTVANMTAGQIINNRNTNSTSQTGAVNISGGATFNFSGGEISGNNNIVSETMFGQQVYISGGTMNFTGGSVIPTDSTRNAIYVAGTGTTPTTTGCLRLSNNAVLDSGFIYCSYPNKAPLILNESLNPGKIFNINLGDNMAGCVLVDGTSAGTYPASLSNFVLNPDLTSLSLSQSGNDIIVGSNAIYLHGSSGNDANDGSTAALAVRTFKRARERLQVTGGNLIIVIGAANLNNTNEISNWDLSFNPNAMVQRGLGYIGYLVIVPAGKTLTLSDITIDGNKENVYSGTSTSNAMIYSSNGSLVLNDGAKVKNNTYHGIYYSGASTSITVNGGEVSDCAYGIYQITGDSFKMTGGVIHSNTNYGIYLNNLKAMDYGGTAKVSENGNGIYAIAVDSIRITGGRIIENNGYGIHVYRNRSTTNSALLISDGELSNNKSHGLSVASSSPALYYAVDDVIITGGQFNNNTSQGLSLTTCKNMSISGVQVIGNNYGIWVNNATTSHPGTLTMTSGTVSLNKNNGLYLQNYINYDITGTVQILENKNSGIYSLSHLPSSISGNVLIKGNRASYGGGLYVYSGTVNVTDKVLFEADTCNYGGGAIYVLANGHAAISGQVKIKDCVNMYTSTAANYGGSAIYSQGRLSMTGGHITGNKSSSSNGTIYVAGVNSDVRLNQVKISDNTARTGGAIYLYNGGRITLDADTITNNTSTYLTSYATPYTGDIHLIGGASGRFSLRDKCQIDGDLFIHSTTDTIYVDEALLNADVGEFHLLGYTTTGTNGVMTLGTVVVSPNASTVTDASQFLTRFTLMNQNTGRGLDKGGNNDKHIMIVNQFFIDGTKPAGGNGSNPLTAFNKLSDLVSKNILTTPYTTVWVSGPVTTTGTDVLPTITKNNVNLRRYTGFAVAAQPFAAYDSVMFTINPGASLTISGGNSAANRFTISGEGGSGFTDASIFKNNGTLTIGGHTYLYFNPIGGDGAAIYQNGTLNLSGNVEFDLYSSNTVYLAEGKVIHITNTFNPPNPIGITVETSPTDTHYPGRVVATGTTTNVPVGMESHFYNELAPPNLPIGRAVTGTTADLMFYIADRNVAGVPIYTTLQDAFDASVPANNDEVRLYGDTEEAVTVDKTLRYNSQGFNVVGSFTLDSTAVVQLLDDLTADTLFIRANTFGKKTQFDRNGKNVTIAKAAYLDLRLPPNPVVGDWYPFNLPFEATVANIRNVVDTTQSLLPMQDFALAAYDGQRRANYGIGNQPVNPNNDWQYFSGTNLEQGTGYMVTTKGIEALRFKAADLALFTSVTAPITYYMGTAGAMHQGINYVAQPMGINSTITGGIANGGIVQVSENFSSDRIGAASYVPKTVSGSLVIAPYTNYFYQTAANGTVSYTKSTAAATVRSGQTEKQTGQTNNSYAGEQPVISAEVPSYYEIRLFDEEPSPYDAVFVAAGPYALKDRYEIGRDVVKMGSIGQTMQLWSADFDMPLCANEATLEDKKADFPLFIHTPVEGKEYTLKLQNVVSYSEQLWLCRNGKMIQNLTECPEFTLDGTGGTMTEYSLRLLTGTTDNAFIEGEASVYTERNTIVITGMQPEQEYAVFDMNGRLFAQGKAKSDRIRITANKGSFVVKINEITHKVVVK